MMNWLSRRGGWAFIFNVAVAALLLWLILPLFAHRSIAPTIVSRYSLTYALYLLAWSGIVACYAVFAFVAPPAANRVVAVAVLAAAIATEAYLRWRGAGGYPGEDAARWPRPYVEFGGKPDAVFLGPERMGGAASDRTVTLNRLGFRGGEPPMPKRGETRVFVLGGSATFNGAPLAQSIPGWIEKLARESGRASVTVYNWGVTSYVSGQELTLLATTVADYDPDVIIVYDGANDGSVPYVYDPRPGYPFNWLVYEEGLRAVASGDVRWQASLARALLRSRLLSTTFRTELTERAADLAALRRGAQYGTAAWRDRIVSSYAGNLRKMCASARGLRAKLVVALQPVLFVKQPLVGSEPVMLLEPAMQQHMTEIYRRFREEIRTLDREGALDGCAYLDVSGALDGQPRQLFWDYVHVTNEGNEIIARRLFAELAARSVF